MLLLGGMSAFHLLKQNMSSWTLNNLCRLLCVAKRLNNLCRLVCAVVVGIVPCSCWSASVMNKNKNNKITQKQQFLSEQKNWMIYVDWSSSSSCYCVILWLFICNGRSTIFLFWLFLLLLCNFGVVVFLAHL